MSDVTLDDPTRIALRVVLDELHKRRETEPVAAILNALRLHNGTTEKDEPWPLGALDEALIGDDGCPECPTGTVQSVGRMEWETGHQPYACDASCGYSG